MPGDAVRLATLCLALLAPAAPALTRSEEYQTEAPIKRRVYDTRRVTSAPPVVDGVLDDPVWETVEWSGDFVQREPSDGDPPTQQSRFKVVYDDGALYFAFRLEDDPDLVRPIRGLDRGQHRQLPGPAHGLLLHAQSLGHPERRADLE